MSVSDEQLEKLLLDFDVIPKNKLTGFRKKAQESGLDLGEYLVRNNHIADDELGQVLADHFKLVFVAVGKEKIDPHLVDLLPESVARAHHTVVYRHNKDRVYVATANPTSHSFLKAVEQRVGRKIDVAYATPRGIERALQAYKSDATGRIGKLIETIEKEPDNQKRIVELVDVLVQYAADTGASDIHMEPTEKHLMFRLRIDGVMHTVMEIPKKLSELILTRIKIMSKLRTDEHRAPQDGKFRFKADSGPLDVRVSIVPVTAGENVVMRLLSTHGRQFFLKDLGFSPPDLKKIEAVITSPHGMILTTGPTGSGKTTTLYTMLQLLHKPEVTIETIEDPVEYDMDGISQIQVNVKADLTFAKGLRSIVRQDPDIIMVGEIRDTETARIAVNSAMTGHLVLSTLHANNAPTAIPRLLDMDIEPFLISSTVNVIIAQRLVRKICERCKVSYEPDAEEKQMIQNDTDVQTFFRAKGYSGKKKLRLYRGSGCASCNSTGYKGRVGIFEVMEMTETLKPLILKRVSSDEIMALAREEGMTTMLEDGLLKALNAVTTLDEVMRVTKL